MLTGISKIGSYSSVETETKVNAQKKRGPGLRVRKKLVSSLAKLREMLKLSLLVVTGNLW